MIMFPCFEVMDTAGRRVMVNASKICSVIEASESTLIVLKNTTIYADEKYQMVLDLISLTLNEDVQRVSIEARDYWCELQRLAS